MAQKCSIKIDFVVLWVDENDPEWQKDLNKWRIASQGDHSSKRFRDWETLRYLFRSFEIFTPWFNKIHLVTQGHVPDWLNLKHKKLNLVPHDQIIPPSNLPVFNCNPIELNIHRINGLADHFIYFNDDMFILKRLSSQRFFKKGLPRDMCAFTSILMTELAHIRLNDLLLINKHFNKKEFMVKQFFKWFNFKYGPHLLKTLLLLPWPHIPGFVDPHQPQPFLKSTFIELWEKEYDDLEQTTQSKFRSNKDVNQYLFRYWQLLKGQFEPVGFSDALCIQVKQMADVRKAAEVILTQKHSLFCINDLLETCDQGEFETAKTIICNAFQEILPNKSK